MNATAYTMFAKSGELIEIRRFDGPAMGYQVLVAGEYASSGNLAYCLKCAKEYAA